MAALDAPAHRGVVQLLCYPRTRPATKAGLLLTAPLDPPPQRHVAGSSNSIEPLARSMKPGFLWHVAQCLDAPASNGAALGRSFVLPDDWPGHVPGFLLLNKCCQAVHFVSMVTFYEQRPRLVSSGSSSILSKPNRTRRGPSRNYAFSPPLGDFFCSTILSPYCAIRLMPLLPVRPTSCR